jgi:hypothetical protein
MIVEPKLAEARATPVRLASLPELTPKTIEIGKLYSFGDRALTCGPSG